MFNVTQFVISYLLVSDKACNLYIDKSKLSEEVANYLKENNVCIKPYEVIGRDVSDIEARKTLYLEPKKNKCSSLFIKLQEVLILLLEQILLH